MLLKIGADPEFFLKEKDHFVSAHDIIPGTKHEPHKLEKGAVQADGTAVEFNIDPAETSKEFAKNISIVLEQIREMIPRTFDFQFVPTVTYEPEYFKKIPFHAKELGCDPDFSTETMKPNTKPKLPGTTRTGAGHLHLGWTEGAEAQHRFHLFDCAKIVGALDNSIGAASYVWDNNNTRRQYYGRYGTFRPKSYGVEYRVLSNAWLKHPVLWPWLFETCQVIFRQLLEPDKVQQRLRAAYYHGVTPAVFNKYNPSYKANGVPFPEIGGV